jgi:hypothetical protein
MICWRSKKASGNGLLEVKEGLWKWFDGGKRRALEMVCWMSKKGSGNGLLVDKEVKEGL